ncbi:hypothetical protein PGT21_015145 [Puccinia graminis f. sp. tritici]|uniref:Uncharacterized protein n=1 Tax=Puccinia graminis f. sp. tritici TaxID=56615 RepID=A0A5B0M2R8_PUCGR|nr:hypothetical protein PGT21_015145 [Puccinia graminis f. sp. tritici]KAA1089875.1 hypothetical protein PGTUg99_025680 [Puccinia graminis f. sp. tritici]
MKFLGSTLALLASINGLVTAYNCGSDRPQNVCQIATQHETIYVRADNLPIRWHNNYYRAGGKNCINVGTLSDRKCCPMHSIQPHQYITSGRYDSLGCGPLIKDPPRIHD